ncbi:hypothetical protein NIES2104_64150 [Leptolyngbya sp. NIES-2104]|nr:hypothetical protein NIES2104_64150 [Leptolyngbya sp. NIES-2104]
MFFSPLIPNLYPLSQHLDLLPIRHHLFLSAATFTTSPRSRLIPDFSLTYSDGKLSHLISIFKCRSVEGNRSRRYFSRFAS